MSQDPISSWLQKAKSVEKVQETPSAGVVVIRCGDVNNKGRTIMEIADKIWPLIMKTFEGVRDENGMLVQPARVRGIALNVAQDIVKDHTEDRKSA